MCLAISFPQLHSSAQERQVCLSRLKDPPDEAHVRRRHAPLLQLRLADPRFARSIHSLQYRCGPIRPLPWEDVTSEMAVSRRVAAAPALGTHKPEIPDQRIRTEAEDLSAQNHSLQLLVRHAKLHSQLQNKRNFDILPLSCMRHAKQQSTAEIGKLIQTEN